MTARVRCALVAGLAATACAQSMDVPRDTLVQLQRTSCLGTCPVYTVTIDARGGITYEGERSVRVFGRRTAQIAPSVVATLLARAEGIRFFDMRDDYRVIQYPNGSFGSPSDMPTQIVTVTANGRTKRVEDYVAAPDALREFEREIDEAAGTKRWIFLDENELEELVRSGWSASSEEGATFLEQAIQRDDITIARRLIELGSRLGGPRKNPLPSLISARSGAMVDLLVKAGADPNERSIGRVPDWPPLMKTAYRDAGVAEALLKAGARLEDWDNGRSALWHAACHGNWRVVTVLLRAGAHPRGGSADMSALECARQSRQFELNRRRTILDRGRPTVEDFDKVVALLESAAY
jgi:hypothetical protein